MMIHEVYENKHTLNIKYNPKDPFKVGSFKVAILWGIMPCTSVGKYPQKREAAGSS